MAVTDHPAHATGCDWFNGQPCNCGGSEYRTDQPATEAGRALRRWVFNEMGITGEGAWTEEFDRRLAAIEQEAAEPYRRVVEAALLWRKRRRTGVAADGELLAALDE